MPDRTAKEDLIVEEFVGRWFLKPSVALDSDGELIDKVMAYVGHRFTQKKYILGLAIDFTVLAEQIASKDKDFKPLRAGQGTAELFKRYPPVESRGSTQANTLTLQLGGSQFGIRKIEELVVDAFHKMERSDFPSAYVYNTGQWKKYEDLLCIVFGLSRGGRRALLEKLFDFGLKELHRNTFYFQPSKRCRVFDEVIRVYPRSAPGENAGLTFQAIAYGWCTMTFSHLQIDADKVRSGSRRQRRFGDIDGYLGLVVEVSVEVKDMTIDDGNYEHQIRQFAELAGAQGIHSLVVANEFSEEVILKMEDDCLIGVSLADLQRTCQMWDWPRQDGALQAKLHYLAHIEQNPVAVKRLLSFVRELDPTHPSLALDTE